MKKLAIIFGSILTLLLIIILVVPILFQDQIATAVKAEANKSLSAKLEFEDYSLSLIRHFPDFTFSLQNVSLTELEENGADTLARFSNLGLTIDIWKAISGEYELKGLELDDALLAVEFDEKGQMNWDIFPSSEELQEVEEQESDGKGLNIELRRIAISNTSIYYTDVPSHMQFFIEGVDLDGSGTFSGDELLLDSELMAKQVSFSYEGEQYLDPLPLELNTELLLNLATSKYGIQSFSGKLAQLNLDGKGFVQMNENDMLFDLEINTVTSTFEQLISVVPSSYGEYLADMKLSGDAGLQFVMKGKMEGDIMPAMDINITTDNATAAYSGYPELVEGLSIKLYAGMPEGPLEGFTAKLSNGQFKVAGAQTNVSFFSKDFFTDPYIKAALGLQLNLQDVKQYVPKEMISNLSGNLDVKNISLETRLSAIEKEQYNKVKFGGRLIAKNLAIEVPDIEALTIQSADLTANPSSVSISIKDFQLGKSDFSVTGNASQFLAYLLNDETIKLALTGTSNNIDVTEIMAMLDSEEEAELELEEEESVEVMIPSNITASIQLAAKQIQYDEVPITNAKASIVLQNSILKINRLSAEGLGGTLNISGRVDGSKSPMKYNLGYALKNLSIQEAVSKIEAISKLAPITKYLEGKFNSELGVSGALTEDGGFDYSTISAEGLFGMIAAKVQDFPPLNSIAEKMKWNAIKNFEIVDQLIQFDAHDGRVNVKPFQFKTGNALVNVDGSHGFDQSMDYNLDIQLPFNEVQKTGLNVSKLNASASKLGMKIEDDEAINIAVSLGGTMEKPEVKVDVMSDIKSKAKDAAKDAVDDVKDAAKDAVDDMKNSAKDAFKDIFNGEKSKEESSSDLKSKADSLKEKAKENSKNWKKKIPW